MKNVFLALIMLGFSVSHAAACINEYYDHTKLSGKYEELLDVPNTSAKFFRHGFDRDVLKKQKAELVAADSSFKNLSDLALIELKIGDRQKGVAMLEELYKKHPGEYNIAANLGTGYELTGRNSEAYALLKKAVTLNPQSHEGSEWIHLKILEQKLQPKPDYTKIINLNIPPGITAYYNKLNDRQLRDLDTLKNQLIFQLRERIAFVPPKDSVVSQLLIDLADVVAITESAEGAESMYRLAATYAPEENSLIESRLNEMADVLRFKPVQKYWYVGVIAMGIAGFAWRITHRRRKLRRAEF
ncbi:MAG TPA: hypothetical protein VEC36_07110 [Patescibacteria group bacterium]|nr:hypothetical protein [Patescibacteria group bacterium]